MPFISNKLNDDTVLNINNYNNYENTNRITVCIDNTTNFLDFYFPKTTLINKKENIYDVKNLNNNTIIKIKKTIKSEKKQIIEFFNIYKETLNKKFYLFYSYYGNIETYSGSGKDFLDELQQN
jgi:hypothetical protein